MWTEDSAENAHQSIALLARKMLLFVDPSCQTQRIPFEPLNDVAARALKGAAWKGQDAKSRRAQVDLIRSIATKLAEENGFVFFRVDGDKAWADRASSDTDANVDAFASHVR